MRVCVLAGSGQLPLDVIKKLAQDKIFTSVIVLETQGKIEDYNDHKDVVSLKFGQIGKALELFKKHKITHLVFAGGVKRPSLTSIIPDFEGVKLLAEILKNKFLGDDNLLKTVLKYFEDKGLKIISPSEIVNLNSKSLGSLTKLVPNEDELKDIDVGCAAFKVLGKLDIGQSILVSEGRIISVEGAEGTDEMIKRSKNYVTSKSILLKFSKVNQDLRVDAPTIGLDTIKTCNANNIAGIVINKNVIILSKNETIELANKLGIYIYVTK